MNEFQLFKKAMYDQMQLMFGQNLFFTKVNKDKLWETYLNSFPAGTNEIFRERNEYDCQYCRQFIKRIGHTVTIIDQKLISIWDINPDGLPNKYVVVAKALSKFVKKHAIENIFLIVEKFAGVDSNIQLTKDNETIRWYHFYTAIPKQYVIDGDNLGKKLSDTHSGAKVFQRGLNTITIDSMETVLDVIAQGSLYRGDEFKVNVFKLLTYKKEYDKLSKPKKELFYWSKYKEAGAVAKIRNSAIGTLLNDLSEGINIEAAVAKFEGVVAPTNYKRPKAIFTKAMIASAQNMLKELGMENSLGRRHAQIDDITINDILFTDETTGLTKPKNMFEELAGEIGIEPKSLKGVTEIGINDFIKDVLPNAIKVELLIENCHKSNLVSLIAPIDSSSPSMFKWPNNFSLTYNGDVADSMRENVKKAGGNITGILRFSIQWNENGDNNNDFDAHCIEPNRNLIDYRNKRSHTGGNLDVDIIKPRGIAIENITWPNANRMLKGKYQFLVHNYNQRNGNSGFRAEIEYDGQIYSYNYPKRLRQGEKVSVAEINFNKNTGIKFIKSLDSSVSSQNIWNIKTHQFIPIELIMFSPNFWHGHTIGNKHYLFILKGCVNDTAPRGFFNEFLHEDLNPHRKVFEALGGKMKVPFSENQLSGLGFSSTKRNSIQCKITGKFNRTLKINF